MVRREQAGGAGAGGARQVVQSKLWPANCRLLDPDEAATAAGLDGAHALLVIGFESSDLPQGEFMRQAVAIARDAGGTVDDDSIIISDEPGRTTGREGSVGAWRDSFINAPYQRNISTGLGLVEDTLETAGHWAPRPRPAPAGRRAVRPRGPACSPSGSTASISASGWKR